jgi:GH25 family lysozyme M1 (1,4-beta-N-acetylmuramidase)
VAVRAVLVAGVGLSGVAAAASSPTQPGKEIRLAVAKRTLAAHGVAHPERDHLGSTLAAHPAGQPHLQGPPIAGQVQGIDVSHHQGHIDWPAAYRAGARFVYIKATEATGYQDPRFDENYTGSYQAGFIRGAYHFAVPNVSSGQRQADFFVEHGGDWSPDGKTLPPMLDIEYNPYGENECYGLSQGKMINWIEAFSDEVHSRTGRWPLIYTTADWWHSCTGDWSGLSKTNPLNLAHWSHTLGTLPDHWGFQTIWQYADSGPLPGDQDAFNGTISQLRRFAAGSTPDTEKQSATSNGTSPPSSKPATTSTPTPTTPERSTTPSPEPTTTPENSTTSSPQPTTSSSPSTPHVPTPSPTPLPASSSPPAAGTSSAPSSDPAAPPATRDHSQTSTSTPSSSSESAPVPIRTVVPPSRFAPSTSAHPAPVAAGHGSPPGPSSGHPASTAGAEHLLAYTGVHLAREVIFAASLVMLGLCVLLLARARAERRG